MNQIHHRGHEEHEEGKGEWDSLSQKVIACAIEVHRRLGPGLLESTYEESLAHELHLANIPFERQKPISVEYKGILLSCCYRIDLLIDQRLIIELKSVESLLPIHQAQLLTYMKLANKKVGLLMNFNVELLKHGLRRFVQS